jgi:hypothetical protein
VLVADDVAKTIQNDYTKACLVVAGCAERMAQIFTGIRGSNPQRVRDVVYYLQVLDDLWLISEVVPSQFEMHIERLLTFPELVPPDDDIVDTIEVAAFFAAVVLMHAVEFRATADVDEALRCAHASLTLLDMVDRGAAGSRLRDHEEGFQLDDVAGLGVRENYQEVSRRRLMVVLNHV